VSLKKRLTKIETPARPGAPARPAATPPAPRPVPVAAAPPAAAAAPRPRANKLDVLAELERLRKQAMAGPSASAPVRAVAPPQRPAAPAATLPARSAPAAAPFNGKGEIHRSVELTLRRNEFRRARRFLLNLRVEDADMQVVDAIRDLPIEISDPADLERVLLHLNVALRSKD
jgi:hypothetical protein